MNESGKQNENPEEPRRGQGGPPRVPRPAFGWLLFAAIGLMLVLMLSGNWNQGAEEITITQFWSLVENRQIVKLTVKDSMLAGQRRTAQGDEPGETGRFVVKYPPGAIEQKLIEEEGTDFVEACSRLGLDLAETDFLARDDEEIAGLEDGQYLIRRAFVAEQLLASEMYQPEKVYLVDMETGTVFFNVLETRLPDEAVWADEGRRFRDKTLRPLRHEAYTEWYQQLEAKSTYVDHEENRRQDRLQAERARAGG